MAYSQYTKCVTASNYSGSVNYIAGGVTALVLGALFLNIGIATLGAILVGIAFCRWWLYGRLVCLGVNQCAIGLALEIFPPELKTGLDREDTDYSVNLLLAPTTLFEGLALAAQDAQGILLAEPSNPDFQAMLKNFNGLGFVGEPEPFSALVNPVGQSPNAGIWQPNYFYVPGSVIQDGNSNFQSCITQGLSGGSMPPWQTVPGQTTSDGFINWVCTGHYSVLTQEALNAIGLINPAAWASNIQYNLGDLILDGNGRVQSCISPGTSGTQTPAWQMLVDEKTSESGSNVQWICLGVGQRWKSTYRDSTSLSWVVTPYKSGDLIIDDNGNLQICTVGGNSGSVTPSWATAINATTSDGQITWTRIDDAAWVPEWSSNHDFYMGTRIVDTNGKAQTCTSSGASGPAPPAWSTTVGKTTQDGTVTWICIGESAGAIGTLEIEFEGGGMYDLYLALLAASPVAAAAAAVGAVPGIGWLLALLLSLIAAAIAGIGYLVGEGDVAAPNKDDPSLGTIYPGQDVLIVMGSWIYDSAHAGWNELHPVLHCQKIATVPPEDLASGNPWANLPDYSAANVENTLSQLNPTRIGWCPLIQETLQPTTVSNQQLPQNGWTIHPSVDGCAASAPATAELS